MKTFFALSLLIVSIFTFTKAHAASVGARPLQDFNLSVEAAEEITHNAFEWRKEHYIMGSLSRDASNEADFRDFERLMNPIFSLKQYELKKMIFWAEQITLTFENLVTHGSMSVTLGKSLAKPVSSLGSTELDARLLPSLHMTIMEGSYYSNAQTGRFVTLIKINGADRIEAGKSYGAFSLSILSAPLNNGFEVGPKADVKIKLKNGIGITLTAELSSKLQLSHGQFQFSASKNLEAQIKLMVERSWGHAQINTAVGARVKWSPLNTSNYQTLTAVFVEIGKTFRNKNGNSIAKIYVFAEVEKGPRESGSMIGIGGTIRF